MDSLVTGSRYYVDPASGNDSAAGTAGAPFKTLAKARSAAKGGDAIILRSGNYGSFTESSASRSKYLVIRNDAGAVPVFTDITLDYQGNSGNAYLAFYGLRISPAHVTQNAGVDPQDPNAGQSTYKKTANPVVIRYASNVKLVGCEVIGQNKYLTNVGVHIQYSERIRVEGCNIHDVHRGTSYQESNFIDYVGNHVHRIAGSAFHSGGAGSMDILIERNHAHDSNYDFSDDYCPRADGANYHGSAVSIRASRMTIRNNVFHDGFNSAGIMTYDDEGVEDMSDIIIENNEIYDLRNPFVLRFYRIKENVVVRNNLIVGHRGSSGAFYYDTAVVLHTLASGADGSALTFDNNVVIGIVNFGEWSDEVVQRNNIVYALRAGTGSFLSQIGNGTTIASSGATSKLFEDGFFKGALRFDWDQSDPDNRIGHGQTIDWELASTALARDYGNAALQPDDGIAGLDEKGFVAKGPARSASRRHAGPRS